MINVSKLLCGVPSASDGLRYGRRPTGPPKPVVVWNCTRRCNLHCRHCYSASNDIPAPDELSDNEAKAFIDDLAAFGAPVLLFSGGEPLLRPGILGLIARAAKAGLRTVLSTNGLGLSETVVSQLHKAGIIYVGVSLDGLRDVHDAFRGQAGAFDQTLTGIRHCLTAGVKVGLRMTLNRQNIADLPGVFDLIEAEGIPRVCFYHLVGAGRGGRLHADALDHAATRAAVEMIFDRTNAAHAAGRKIEVLTVDNHADGVLLYQRLLRTDPTKAEHCLGLLKRAGGNRSGAGIGCVRWNGDVLPDQFWASQVIGNVRRRPFSAIWSDTDNLLLKMLRNRRQYLTGRCTHCRWLDVCNGNLRARAEAAGSIWGDDPACYLTNEEIATK